MFNFTELEKITIVGGGTAGWFAAFILKDIFRDQLDITVIESSEIDTVGVGEGGLPILFEIFKHHQIDINEFIRETNATLKWGFSYEGWRTGAKDDQFYHLFWSNKHGNGLLTELNDFFPYISQLIAKKTPLSHVFPGIKAIENHVSQAEALQYLQEANGMITSSFHFDSHLMGKFLSKKAKALGVKHRDCKIIDVHFDLHGAVKTLVSETEMFDADFVIDASGLSRLIIGKMDSEWVSFADQLPLDRAIPFNMPHPFKNPALCSRAIAMKAGWMWQIPLQTRVGAGYVFSSKHTTTEQALEEIKQYLGFNVDARDVITFSPGSYKEVWKNNVLALGLSSGFVEPLEATSIGQMLIQLNRFASIILNTNGVVADQTIAGFNEANHSCWLGIRDFLQMHYDVPRNDTPFWQDVSKMPKTANYRDLKDIWQLRGPRHYDIGWYAQHGWQQMFGLMSWLFVGNGVGAISQAAAQTDIASIPEQKRKELKL